MRVDRPTQWAVTITFFAVAGVVTMFVLRSGDRRVTRFRVLVLIGGAMTVVFEPAIDRLGNIWYADQGGHWQLLRLYGISVGLWALPVYYWFIGGQTLYTLGRFRRSITRADVWRLYLLFVAMDALFEITVLKLGGIYTYWGAHQPLWNHEWFPLPGWYLAINGLLPLIAAGFVMLVLSTRDARLHWTIPVVVPMSMFVVYAMTAWPTIAAVQSSVSLGVADLCAGVTIALSVLTAFLFARLLPRLATAVDIPGNTVHRQATVAPEAAGAPQAVRA
ncbi:MAG: hypothetical protein ACYDHH_20685 [Solirubrobacteraceae bacterium]